VKTTRRPYRVLIEALLACAACFALALLAPLSLWQSLGGTGSALATLALAAAATGLVAWRSVRGARATGPHSSVTAAPAKQAS
jgi:hypothetical protein